MAPIRTLAPAAAIILVMTAAAGRASVDQGVDPAALPEGEGKAILVRACTGCHDVGTVVAKRLTPAQWKDVTREMISRGVSAKDAEIKTLIEYLAVNAGHVNVNRATEAELSRYGGFSAAEASAIAAARARGQSFQTLDDLKALPGIDGSALDSRRERIAFKDAGDPNETT